MTDLDRMLLALAAAERDGRLCLLPATPGEEVTEQRRSDLAETLLAGVGLGDE